MPTKAHCFATILAVGTIAGAAAIAGDGPIRVGYERVANEGTIGDRWMLAPGATLPAPAYPAHLAAAGGNACIALGYLIGRDGRTSDFAVLKQWNSVSGESEPVGGYWQAFAQAGADAVSQWRFQPRPGVVPVPTYTVATLGFTAGGAGDANAVTQHCRIPELQDHLAKMQSESHRNDIIRQRLESDRRRQRDASARESLRRINTPPPGR